ncbi:MAG: outer membrane beta-barrel protein [Leptospirales bacterium]
MRLKRTMFVLTVFLGFSGLSGMKAMADPLPAQTSSSSSASSPIDFQGHLMGGLDAGIAIPSQDITPGTQAIEGPAVQGSVFYGLTNNVQVGLDLGWYQTGYAPGGKFAGNLGDLYLLPTVMLRGQQNGAWSPYATVGLGANINMFSSSEPGLSISPTDTFAMRFAIGEDYFMTSHLALNAELSWLMNTGMWTETTPGGATSGSTFNNSAVFLMAGIHFM